MLARGTVGAVALGLVAVFAAAQPTYLILSSYSDASCDPATMLPFNLTVPLGSCLNNHDFDKAPCEVLQGCVTNLTAVYGPTVPYEAMVNCTAAPSMHLSVLPTYDAAASELEVKVYAISKACWGLGLPLHFASGACASTFAVSKHCGVSGASVSWV